MDALWCSLAALLLAGSGGGSGMETTLQDDAVLLHRPPAQVREAARQIAALGADRVRITAGWSALAPEPSSRRRPGQPFDATDSRTYPRDGWRRLDTAVRAATDAGLGVQIDVAFWAPRWAVARAMRGRRAGRERWAPDPREFGAFAAAVARRYDGAFPDPEDPRRALPAVRLYTTWNEPNHPSFLAPQWRRDRRGRPRPASPHVYRALHEAAYAAIKNADARNQVLIGGTAATGSRVPGKGGVPPLEFLRALACVDRALRPLKVPECRGFTPLRADGWAHHPYSRFTTPGTSDPDPDDVPIADLDRLSGLLDALRRRGRIAAPLPLYLTEYGYETRPPDPYQRFTPEQQARFHGWATWLAWRRPDTRMFAQFLLRDIDERESGARGGTRKQWRDWQTGLYYADGRPKPAVQAFRLPFWAQAVEHEGRRAVLLFGQVRPGRGRQVVRVERLEPTSGAWRPIDTAGPSCGGDGPEFLTDGDGVFLQTAPLDGLASYRMSWLRPDGEWESGVPVAVDPEQPVPVTGAPPAPSPQPATAAG